MTDNRTNEPTEAQVEAAWQSLLEMATDVTTRADVRAALVAAQGAAPQAGEEHFHIWSELPCKTGQCHMDHAPVLPSSGVDEDALAEEIGRHKLVHVSVSRKSAFCACNPSVTAGVDDNRAWFEGHRARAVAAWLKDGAR